MHNHRNKDLVSVRKKHRAALSYEATSPGLRAERSSGGIDLGSLYKTKTKTGIGQRQM